jgi:glycosyltransferase involved in cell wall biosynthesis
MKVTVIISTFNAPEWLEKVIWGYSCQTHKDFSIVIADDGSGPETKILIDKLTDETGLDITHLWHPHKGYRRQTILNRAIVESKGDYLILTDGDCIPRKDFVAIHVAQAEKGRFLSGGYCKLSMKVSKSITRKDIVSQNCFDAAWLKGIDSLGRSQSRKLNANGFTGFFFDMVTTAKASFNNCNSSAWKEDMLAVNGYDERMQYGGADREIGERLTNNGIRGKQIRHRAIVVHLDHARGYKTKESISHNKAIRKETRTRSLKRTPFGIRQLQS